MLIHRLKHPRTPPLYHSMVQTFTVWTSWHVRSSDDKYPWPECGKLTPVTTRQVRLWVHNNKLKAALMLHTSTDCSYSTLNFFQWLLSWLLHRISVTNLSSENNLPTFWLNAPVVIRAKDGNSFLVDNKPGKRLRLHSSEMSVMSFLLLLLLFPKEQEEAVIKLLS